MVRLRHVTQHRVHVFAEFAPDPLGVLDRTDGRDDSVPGGCERLDRAVADTRAGAGDQNSSCHVVVLLHVRLWLFLRAVGGAKRAARICVRRSSTSTDGWSVNNPSSARRKTSALAASPKTAVTHSSAALR